MKIVFKNILVLFIIVSLGAIIWNVNADVINVRNLSIPNLIGDTIEGDTNKLPFNFNDNGNYDAFENKHNSPLYLDNPSNIKSEVVYDPITNQYHFKEKIGDIDYRTPVTLSFDDYQDYQTKNTISNNWKTISRNNSSTENKSLIPTLRIGGDVFDAIFGSNTIDIRPQGSAELIFGLQIRKTDNPNIPEKNRRTTTFNFDEKIQMNVTGQIGDKMKIRTKYDTEASFEFENEMKLAYEGDEDEIIQKIEAGNVSLPLTGSLITGSQSLFGLKTDLKFGKLTMTNVFSQQKGKKSVIDVEGGAQTTDFEIYADDYDANRHFFLAQYFRDNYDKALETLPVIKSPATITKVEVWVTNKTGNFENSRNIVAFMDLGEGYKADGSGTYVYNPAVSVQNPTLVLPSDSNNTLNNLKSNPDIRNVTQVTSTVQSLGFNAGTDYEKLESARKLLPSEYTLHPKLGYIDLNSSLNSDEILAVAYEYIVNGKVYRVGEFSNSGIDAPKTLITKLIKGTNLTPKLPTWKLMMKNIYSLGAYQVSNQDFEFYILYQNNNTGTPVDYIEAGDINNVRLIEVLNLDRLDNKLEPYPDGNFDFVDGYTISAKNGKIIFPVLEPFGSYLEKKINNPIDAKKYVFQELYDSTQSNARQVAEKNKFLLKGRYKSSSGSDISLNALNVPKGSVTVTAGGRQLTENVDYTVDYLMGRVKIINPGLLESGTPIQISLESNSLFSIQSKTLLGTHFNYNFSKNLNVGATILNLTERPLTQKVNIGEEPISNTIWGFNGDYNTDVPILTKIIDKIPFIDTKEMSTITVTGEFAQLIPGHSKAIDKDGKAYIDDFEGTKTSIDMRSFNAWFLASTPQHQDIFKESVLTNNVNYGKNRARIAWYRVDPSLTRNDGSTPQPLKNNKEEQNNHFVREIYETELFPERMPPNNISPSMPVLNIAYYPEQKGPYNYDVAPSAYSAGIDSKGNLLKPETRWGGVMRSIVQNDFETANIEFIEFWLMDPFVYDKNSEGGELYFNLGNISEDILKDSRKEFEDGLPTSSDITLVDTTAWGRVSTKQSLVNSFDNDQNKKKYQDIGLDGLNDDAEKSFFLNYLDSIQLLFGSTSAAYINAEKDPSNDNFHFYKGDDYDAENLGILERYKYFNGLEGNSITPSEVNSTNPDVEDINTDNTLSEGESYYQYKVDLKPQDMVIGQNYISDIRTGENKDGDKVNYYQFRIPIREPDKVVGGIQDFKSIRFMRMFLTGFKDSVFLRFATLDLVRSEWRKYNNSFLSAGPYLPTEPANTLFDVTAVNIEENGDKKPVNYVLPNGVTRQIDPMNPQLRELNEQSMVLAACGLQDGDARAAYKNIRLDFRQYKKIQMFIHAEAQEGETVHDGDVTVFVRLGSDYQDNYYEYEIPVKITPPGSYNKDNEADRYAVWPTDNMLDLSLSILQQIKQDRNRDKRQAGSTVTFKTLYTKSDGVNKVSIMGNPDLSNIRTIMIGIRNPKKETNPNFDDGLSKCVEVWVNELRMSSFDEKGGWAATSRVTTKLADFGNLTLSGTIIKHGFGSIEKKVNERHKEDIYQYDVTSNFELGKFFPEKSGISIPMYASVSEGITVPQYNPAEPDIPLKEALNDKSLTSFQHDSIRKLALDLTKRKSLNFTNVKFANSKGKPKIYSLSNISTSYSYTELESSNYNMLSFLDKTYSGMLAYSYNNTPKCFEPFKRSKLLRSKKYLRLITDFNLYFMPRQLSFTTDIGRRYSQKQIRNVIVGGAPISPTYNKDFNWNRMYDLKWDFTKSLKFDFNANNIARIDEPYLAGGRVDKQYEDEYQQWKDTVMQNIMNFGRNFQYHHQFNLTYTLPINKIPLLNWINSTVRYSGNYDWTRSPVVKDMDLGNTIKNSNSSQVNVQANFLRLYNKVKFLKDINRKAQQRKRNRKPKKQYETVTYPKKGDPDKIVHLKSGVKKFINHKLKTPDVTVKFFDENNKEIKGEVKIISDNKIYFIPDSTYKHAKVVITGKREKKESLFVKIAEQSALTLMGVKNIQISYSNNQGTLLPGYKGETYILGMDDKFKYPGWPFVMGWQDDNFGEWISQEMYNGEHLITTDSLLNLPYLMNSSANLNIRGVIEPLPGLRINLDAVRNDMTNTSKYYVYESANNDFVSKSEQFTGNFSMSFNTWNTAFEKLDTTNNSSPAFEQLKQNRIIIAQRLANQRAQALSAYDNGYNSSLVDSAGFPNGYSQTSQDVLIYSFLAAYSGENASKVPLDYMPKIPNLNWRITYDGLTKFKLISHYLRKITLSHSYRSTFNIGAYTTNLSYSEGDDGYNWVREDLQKNSDFNFIPEREIATVSINEMFAPLAGIDMTLKNGLIAKIEFKRSRNLTFSLSNNQLTEMNTKEYVFGTGYRFKNVEINITSGGNTHNFKSDVNIRADLSIRDNYTIIRKLMEEGDQFIGGQTNTSLKLSADYMLSDRFQLRLFFDKVINAPKISNNYRTANTNFGISVKFTLTQ